MPRLSAFADLGLFGENHLLICTKINTLVCKKNDYVPDAHCVFLAKKRASRRRAPVEEFILASVAITFTNPQSGSRQHEFNVSLKEQTSLSTDKCVEVEF